MVYQWKQNRFETDAQKVGEELERLQNKTAESVVEAARKSRGELHRSFEWDDTVAGEEYRKEQARLLLRLLVTPIEIQNGKEPRTVMIRALESVRIKGDVGNEDRGMVYVPTKAALTDPEFRLQIMNRLERTIEEAEDTAATYAYLVPQFTETKKKLSEARATIRA